MPTTRRRWIGAVAAFAAAASCFGPLVAAAQGAAPVDARPATRGAPPADVLRALRRAYDGRRATVWSGGRRYELPRAAFDSAGVWSRDRGAYRAPRVAIVEGPGASGFVAPPRPVPWDAVDSVGAVPRDATGAVIGVAAVGGALLGFVTMGQALGRASSGGSDGALRYAIAVPFGVAAAFVTAMLLPDRPVRVVYRAR